MIDFYMLHGFLGRGSDWDPIREGLRNQYKDSFYRQPDLLFQEHDDLSPTISIQNWGASFNAWARESQATIENRKRVLLGYSMGGRLGLHALNQRGGQWDAAIIMSANPGVFFGEEDVAQRQQWEQDWMHRFLEEEDWDYLMELWNSQPVFAGDKQPYIMPEEQFSRSDLSYAIQNWSLLEHSLTLDNLKKLNMPILWMVGENDSRYMEIYNFLKSDGYIQDFVAIPNCGHRILRSKDPEILLSIMVFLSQALGL